MIFLGLFIACNMLASGDWIYNIIKNNAKNFIYSIPLAVLYILYKKNTGLINKINVKGIPIKRDIIILYDCEYM